MMLFKYYKNMTFSKSAYQESMFASLIMEISVTVCPLNLKDFQSFVKKVFLPRRCIHWYTAGGKISRQ